MFEKTLINCGNRYIFEIGKDDSEIHILTVVEAKVLPHNRELGQFIIQEAFHCYGINNINRHIKFFMEANMVLLI
jgi:hypothetical protein